MKRKQEKIAEIVLPNEIWFHVFSFFNYDQLGKLERVCKNWRKIIVTNSFWSVPELYSNKQEFLAYRLKHHNKSMIETKKLVQKKEKIKKVNLFCIGDCRDIYIKSLDDNANDYKHINLVSFNVHIKKYNVYVWKSINHKYLESSQCLLNEENTILLVFSDNEGYIKDLQELKDAIAKNKITFLINSHQSQFSLETLSLFTKTFTFATTDPIKNILTSVINYLEKLAVSNKNQKNKCSIA